MASASTIAVLGHYRALFATGSAGGLTDAQLLEQLARAAGTAAAAEAAFEVLLARHGPMVLGVCRRALIDPGDAEDAFQATFLVLVRKSSSVRVDDSLGRWLYGVARRVVRRTRFLAERRRRREPSLSRGEPAVNPPDAERAELLAALDDELARLPEKYRTPLQLCYLEGLSHTEAALRLRWPAGTVKGRLAHGRSLLRARLMRRGLAPCAALLGMVLEAEARVAVPATLARKTVGASLRFAIGGTTGAASASATVLALSKGTLNAMMMIKLRTAALCLLAALEMTAGAIVLAHPRPAGGDESAIGGEDDPGANSRRRSGSALARAEDERGSESRSTHASDLDGTPIVNRVKATTTITFLVADGSRVQKGDVICKLDPEELKAELADRKIAALGAKSAHENARRTREIAEIAVKEYKEGVFQMERLTVLGEIQVAIAAKEKAEDRLSWSNRMLEKGYVSGSQNIQDKIALKQKLFALEQAQTKKSVLEKYTYSKTMKELEREVEKAQSDELAKSETSRREQERVAALEQEIANCRITAPVSGRLVYVRWRIPGDGGRHAKVVVGEVVRWRQLLFRIKPGAVR